MSGKRIARRLPPRSGSGQIPEDWPMTLREYKALKRHEALTVERALTALIYGSAYLPPVERLSLVEMRQEIRRARGEWSKWWRNA